jgi:glutamate synthase domain-containing protein 3
MTSNNTTFKIDATGVYYRDLNEKIRQLIADGAQTITLENVCGQRYIGTDIDQPLNIEIYGTPGNDLGSFMNGPTLTVYGNAQDGCGNTMNEGEIVVHGHAGDITGLSARGGKIFIKDGVGYRAGIHMKEYQEKKPALVIGGTVQDFAAEYMAGGIMVILGLNLRDGEKYPSKFIGTGMHGGVIYLRGTIDDYQLGKEVGIAELDDKDRQILNQLVNEFCKHFSYDYDAVMNRNFIKLYPRYLRPYGRLYAY